MMLRFTYKNMTFHPLALVVFMGVPVAFWLIIGAKAAGWALLAMIAFQIVLNIILPKELG